VGALKPPLIQAMTVLMVIAVNKPRI